MRSLCLMLLSLAVPAGAVTVYSVTGPLGGGYASDATQELHSAWSQTGSYSNVSISALLGGMTGVASAYLTTTIGPGTTAGDVVASTMVGWPAVSPDYAFVQIFSGLNLGPGDYYLIIGGTGQGDWGKASAPTVVTDTGVTALGQGYCSSCATAFVPANSYTSFALGVQLVVEGEAVPEPGTFWLLLAGLLLFGRRSLHAANSVVSDGGKR